MQEKDKDLEQKLREGCLEYLEEYESVWKKRQRGTERLYNKQTASTVFRLLVLLDTGEIPTFIGMKCDEVFP